MFSFFLQCECPIECESCSYKDGKCNCNSCKIGFYGRNCKERCNEKCKNGCTSTFGICNGCIKGYTGFYCSNTCSQKCIYGCKQISKSNCYSNDEEREREINEGFNDKIEEEINNENIENNEDIENIEEKNEDNDNENIENNKNENEEENNNNNENIEENNEEENTNKENGLLNQNKIIEDDNDDKNEQNKEKNENNPNNNNNKNEKISSEINYMNVINNLNQFYNKGQINYIIEDTYSIYIYDTNNQPKNRDNESNIDISSCEIELKNYYKIPLNEPLIIIKMDSLTDENFPTNKINYEIYSSNYQKLDKTICSRVTIEIPIKNGVKTDFDEIISMQNSGIDLTDKTDSFFNDLCVPYEKGMPFKDRKSLYVNITFCDKECDLNSFVKRTNSYEVICDCGKEYAEKAELKRKAHFVKSVFNSNFFVIRCYKVAFNLKILKKNWGFHFYTTIIILQIINLCFFIYYGFKSLKKHLYSLLPIPSSPIINVNQNSQKLKLKSKSKYKSISKNYIIPTNSRSNTIENENNIVSILPTEKNIIDSTIDNVKNEIKENEKENINVNKDEKKEIIDPEKLSEDQLESFSYKEAVQYDKRGLGKTYLYSILHKQVILSAIFVDTKSKFRCIKISTILIGITLSFGFNAIFFSQSMQHRRYEGDNSIWIRIPKVIISFFSTIIFTFILTFFSSYDDNLNDLSKNGIVDKEKIYSFLKLVKKKIISFYIIMSCYTLFFWYFCTAYCAIYAIYQKPWFIDSLQTLFLAQFSPFLFCFLYVSFRLSGIRCKIYVFFIIGRFLNFFLDSKYKKFMKLCS